MESPKKEAKGDYTFKSETAETNIELENKNAQGEDEFPKGKSFEKDEKKEDDDENEIGDEIDVQLFPHAE